MRLSHLRAAGLIATLALLGAGCNQRQSAGAIAQNGGLAGAQAAANAPQIPAGSGQVVGQISWVSINESIGYVSLKGGSVPNGAYLVALDREKNPVAVMQATSTSNGKTQAFFIISGAPAETDVVIEPDQNHVPLVQRNVSLYNRRSAAAAFQEAGTAAPLVVPGQ